MVWETATQIKVSEMFVLFYSEWPLLLWLTQNQPNLVYKKTIWINKAMSIHPQFFQENYERMKALVDELKSRTEKIKLGKCEHLKDENPSCSFHSSQSSGNLRD